MQRISIAALVLFGVVIGCSSPESGSNPVIQAANGLQVYQPGHAVEVELFAPGAINSSWPEFGISFTATGDTVYFDRTIKDRTKATIMQSIRVDGVWQTPSIAPFSGPTFDVDPFVTPDGGVFYGSLQFDVERDSLASFDLWFWPGSGDPVRLPRPLNSDDNESFLTATLDGTLYFGSNRNGSAQIFESSFLDGVRSEPRVIPISGVTNPGNPLITPDGSTLVFASENPDGWTELSFICKMDGAWSSPVTFPEPINSSSMEYAPGMDPEGYLYFASERPGMVSDVEPGVRPPADIYKSNLNVLELCSVE
jgi:hypothetical protein